MYSASDGYRDTAYAGSARILLATQKPGGRVRRDSQVALAIRTHMTVTYSSNVPASLKCYQQSSYNKPGVLEATFNLSEINVVVNQLLQLSLCVDTNSNYQERHQSMLHKKI